MIVTAAQDILNNQDTIHLSQDSEKQGEEFSAALENAAGTLGDVKNKDIVDKDNNADFKEFLSQVTSEANVETSLNLTLTKDIAKTIENTQADDIEKKDLDENGIVLFAQTLETTGLNFVSQTDTAVEPVQLPETPDLPDLVETAPKVETDGIKIENDNEHQELALDDDMLNELNIESIKVETESSSDNSSLLNQQSAEEQGIKILLNQETKTFELPKTQEVTKPVEIAPSKIIEQVTKHLETLQNTSKVNIVLQPEALGKVTIQLVKSPEGLSAQFTTATQEARNILMKGLEGLKETLTAHGVGVDNVSVKINDTQKSEYNANWTEQEGSRGGNKEQQSQNREEKEKGLFEKTIAQKKENGKV